MSSHLYYKKYKKVPKEKIKNEDIPLLIKSLLRDASTEDIKLFLESLMNYYKTYDGLTSKQFNALKDVENSIIERTSEEYKAWTSSYDDKKRKIAKLCAHYYEKHPPYYSSLIKNILTKPDFVPTEKQFNSMCDNEYTRKVLLATFSDPIYKNGEFVQGRKNALERIKNKYCTIIASNDRPVVHAAQGAKTYLVLPIGETKPAQCEERHLKSFKKNA